MLNSDQGIRLTPSTFIGLLSVLVVGVACFYASLMGAPNWLAGNEAAVVLKVAGAVGLVILGERFWRAPRHKDSD